MFKINQSGSMTIVSGDTGIIDFELDNDLFRVGDVVYFTVKRDVGYHEISIQQIIEITEETNKLKIFLPSEETNIPPGDYYYDIQINFKDGRVDTVIGPKSFSVLGGVTSE